MACTVLQYTVKLLSRPEVYEYLTF